MIKQLYLDVFLQGFFERVNDRALKDMIKASQDLQRVVPSEQYASIAKEVLDMGARWNVSLK